MMRRSIFLGLISLLLAFSACKKDEQEVTDPGSVSFKYDGKEWKATKITGQYVNVSNSTTIDCYNGYEQLFITFKGLETGVFQMDEMGKYSARFKEFTTYYSFDPVGEITVTGYNSETKRISGTFHFIGVEFGSENQLEITDGIFTNVPLEFF